MNETHDDPYDQVGPSRLTHDADDKAASPGLTRNKADAMTPGEILREGRLAHDYSVDDLCAQTKLGRHTIAALEDNDFQSLSQPVFAGGYYRQCAKVLDLDVDRLMAAYQAIVGTPPRPRIARGTAGAGVVAQNTTPRGGFRLRGLFLLLVIAAAAIAAILFVWPSNRVPGTLAGNSDDGNAEQTHQATTTYEFNSSNDDDKGEADIAGMATDSVAANDTSGDHETTTPDTPDEASGQARSGRQPGGRNVSQALGLGSSDQTPAQGADAGDSSPASAPSVPPNRLVLTFDKRSWVQVTDANGNRMASGIFESGDKKEFNGKPPYKITLGFAPGVKVTIGGQPVDVAGHTSGGSVAHLNVGAPAADTAQSAG